MGWAPHLKRGGVGENRDSTGQFAYSRPLAIARHSRPNLKGRKRIGKGANAEQVVREIQRRTAPTVLSRGERAHRHKDDYRRLCTR
jgi:hypothetical protein